MKGKRGLGAKVFCESIVCSEKFVESCRTMFDPLMKQKAEKVCYEISLFCKESGREGYSAEDLCI